MEEKMIGDFRILEKISETPLETLYLGEHKFIKRKFAIKVFHEELSSNPEFIDRFEKEIGKMAEIDHLNIVKVHNVSFDEGRFFVVTDFITDSLGEYKNLSQYLARQEKRLSEEEIASILKQVAYGLDHLHNQKLGNHYLYHGGLKLSNLLVGKTEGNRPHIYLSDVGYAPIIGAKAMLGATYSDLMNSLADEGKIETRAKLQRSFLQNFAFLAPEQRVESSFKVGPKADIYAFGVLTYFLLMGYLPEGYFKMPSETEHEFSLKWDRILEATLKQNPSDRCDSLVALFDGQGGSRQRELSEIEPRLAQREAPKSIEEAPPKMRKVAPPKSENPSIADHLSAYRSNNVRPMGEDVRPYRPEASTTAVLEEEKKPVLNPSELRKHEYEEDPAAIFKKSNVIQPYKPTVKEVQEVEPMLTEMVILPAGEYMRGSDIGARDEKPRHKVFVDSFALDIHPVTNEQFVRFLEVMGGEKDSDNNDMILLKESRVKRLGGKLIIESGYAKHPIVGVSWYGARAYAKWVGKRLPTEAEWEIAGSSGIQEEIYPSGADIERSQANFFSSDTTVVMSYRPNPRGFYDIAGNVYEWCEDWYGYNYYETSQVEPTNPKGPAQGVYRVLRGGCWKSLKDDLRVSHRHRNNPSNMNRTYGFRCATDVA